MTRPCGTCGMPCTPGEYHPYAACLMFKACHNSETVRANLEAVRATPQPTQAQAGLPWSWVDEVRQYLTAAADSSMSRNNSEQLASELLEQMPTKAQAGAVPLTEQQIKEMWYDEWDGFVSFAEAEVIVRATEEAHGIKGGQHGADT